MKKVIRMTESQLRDIIEKVVSESKDDKFIQKATKEMEKKGTSGKFGKWCKDHGFGEEVTLKCINKAMGSEDSDVVKMANFAKNIGGYKGAKK
jgi:hypothetical protein